MLVRARKNSKHELEHDGPCEITQVNDNGTVRFQKGIVNDVINIGRIKPFHKHLLNGGHTLCVESVSRHCLTPATPCATTRAQSSSPVAIRHHKCRLAGLSHC
jgi:hypothetical protein